MPLICGEGQTGLVEICKNLAPNCFALPPFFDVPPLIMAMPPTQPKFYGPVYQTLDKSSSLLGDNLSGK